MGALGGEGPREEQWEHAVLRFGDSRLGFFNWSSIAYDSALRWPTLSVTVDSQEYTRSAILEIL